ncbi:MAG: type IV pilus assembly protein PilC [Phenylobacterium sp.]|jgi:type IV pilus assembly protein PilC
MAAKKEKEPDVYSWSGVNRNGKKMSGEVQAGSIVEAKAQVRRTGATPTKVKKKPKPLFGGGGKAIAPVDIAVFTRQVATMLQAGVALVQTLEMIAMGTDSPKMKKLITDLNTKVQSGIPFSETLRDYPLLFDDLYCDLVNSGEQSGALDNIFARVATYKEKAEALKSKIKKAMTYPIAVLAIAGIVTSILLIFVVPQFQEIFEGFGAELPAFTLFVVGLSETMQAYWWMVVIAMGIGGYMFVQTHRRSLKFRDKVDGVMLKAPVIGMILNKAAVARFARTLSTTFAAGVPLIEALESAAGASGNAVYRYAILEVRSEVSAGNQMNFAMKNTGVFPPMVTQMVAIGEESGALDSMLDKVANIYEGEVDDAVDGLTALIEPMIMAFLGVVIGGLIISMYLPIFDMGKIIN